MATVPALKMSAEIAQKIREHGAQGYPNECCGALLGRDADGTSTATIDGGERLKTVTPPPEEGPFHPVARL